MTRRQSHADALAIQQRSFQEENDAIRVHIVNGEVPTIQTQQVAPAQEVRIERIEVPVIVEKEVKEIVYIDRPVIVEKFITERIEVPVVVRETVIEKVEVPFMVHTSSSGEHSTNIVEKDIPNWVKACLVAQFIISTISILEKLK